MTSKMLLWTLSIGLLLDSAVHPAAGQQVPTCAPCADLQRVALGPCACGPCLPTYSEWFLNSVPQAQCLADNVCAGTPGTRWDSVRQGCFPCPNTFETADCQPCTNTDCTACPVDHWYDAGGTGCTARGTTIPAGQTRILGETATRDWVSTFSADTTAIAEADHWTTMLAVLAEDGRLVADAKGRVMGADGRLWPRVQYAVGVRCGTGHFAPSYLGPAALAVSCTLLECPENTTDHDSSPLTACRRVTA